VERRAFLKDAVMHGLLGERALFPHDVAVKISVAAEQTCGGPSGKGAKEAKCARGYDVAGRDNTHRARCQTLVLLLTSREMARC